MNKLVEAVRRKRECSVAFPRSSDVRRTVAHLVDRVGRFLTAFLASTPFVHPSSLSPNGPMHQVLVDESERAAYDASLSRS